MDFDIAVNKLARNHTKQLRRSRYNNKNNSHHGNSIYSRGMGRNTTHLSQKAKKEADERKQKSEEKRKADQIKKNKLRKAYAYFSEQEREIGTVKSLERGTTLVTSNHSNNINSGSLLLQPTSIHGDGDKITLPVSVLETLMELENGGIKNSSPYEFRVGIPNPEYKFPMSPSLIEMMEKMSGFDDYDEHDEYDEDFDIDENHLNESKTNPFIDELSYKYLAYTHATVVEFTQEEGYVGLPSSIADALINNKQNNKIAVTKTVDPAANHFTTIPQTSKTTTVPGINSSMDEDEKSEDFDSSDAKSEMDIDERIEEKTPGHVAWGKFDVPDVKVEIVLLHLPKGKSCTLTPNEEAIKNGFYQLDNVKAVLEQSLIRTRATLSVNDTVHCWHRGVKFDLSVSTLTPNKYSAVSCINTDIEVELGSIEGSSKETNTSEKKESDKEPTSSILAKENNISPPNPGRTLRSTVLNNNLVENNNLNNDLKTNTLPEEPPLGQKVNTCIIQVRGNGITGRRRFDVDKSSLKDLFSFALTIGVNGNHDNGIDNQTAHIPFRLVTRFPRRVFEINEDSARLSLKDGGIKEGQHMFMIEPI